MKINQFIKESSVIDLSGPQGNAFALLGIAKRLASKLDFDWNKIEKEMTSGDYTNLVDIFKQYFGNYVDINEKQEMCPEACCGVPVSECHCPADCPHCDCNAPGGPNVKKESKQNIYINGMTSRKDVIQNIIDNIDNGNVDSAVDDLKQYIEIAEKDDAGISEQDVPKDHEYGPSSKDRPEGKRGYTSGDKARTTHLKTVKQYARKKRRQMDKTTTTENNPAPEMNIYNLYTTKSKDGDFQAWQGNKHLGSFKTIEGLDKFLIHALNSGQLQPQT